MTSRNKKALGATFLLLLIIGTVWIVKFRGTSTLRTAEGAIFGTYYHIKYEAPTALDADIAQALHEVDASMSVFNKQSTLSAINASRSEQTDPLLYDVVKRALTISKATDGAFDVTVMPLVNAWGFGFKQGSLPTPTQIDSLRQFVGIDRITLTPDSLLHKSDPRVMVDCGAIAKGYGVDRVAHVLRKHGVRNYMVEIGGEVVVKGRNPNGRPWQIGISKPIDDKSGQERELQTVLSLQDCAVATSGNYRNFYVKDGRKYAHTIDPRTGQPVQHSLLSATVMAPDCATADAYATAFMGLGVEGAQKVLDKHKELRVYFIYEDTDGSLKVYRKGM